MFGRQRDSDPLSGQAATSVVVHQRRAEMLAARHQSESLAKREMAKADVEVLSSLSAYSLGHEISTLNLGEGLAGGRRAVLELTARKVSQQAALNDRLILKWCG